MKLTDLSILFVIIMLPMVIIVYVNTSFVIKAEKEEMYYKTIIDTAIEDATTAMKEIENTNLEIDYGYSGITDNKVSINAQVAIDTFYRTLFNNFGIEGNKSSEEQLKSYIPVIAVMDYDGIYIHSAEEREDTGNIEYVTKPKQYYIYTYGIKKDALDNLNIIEDVGNESNLEDNLMFQVVFTMDEYIYLKIYDLSTNKVVGEERFYLNDESQWYKFVDKFTGITSDKINNLNIKIIDHLRNKRQEVIIQKIQTAVSATVNKHNYYANQLGMNYEFVFSNMDEETWYKSIDGIGMIAVIQGISLGNRYLNYNAYSTSTLLLSKKYLLSNEIFKNNEESSEESEKSYLSKKLYHISDQCPIFKEYIFRWRNEYWELAPKFFYKKSEAATNGYLPCPVCKP